MQWGIFSVSVCEGAVCSGLGYGHRTYTLKRRDGHDLTPTVGCRRKVEEEKEEGRKERQQEEQQDYYIYRKEDKKGDINH
ncbi:hypothetical protein Q7C36_018261 [Tachysurus vachellii]|uniref:Uncharacterized protein n=1 Tax=Tachysurus vachellii TaxID=175792 RepID=A0AA88S394_TACVA|nr:hypothetical protein Q7C36_018261 [Tachysurus vachellii]